MTATAVGFQISSVGEFPGDEESFDGRSKKSKKTNLKETWPVI